MKKIYFMLICIFAICFSSMGNDIKPNFNRVKVSVPSNVRVIESDSVDFNVRSNNKDMMNAIETFVDDNGELVIRLKPGYKLNDDDKIRIDVTAPKDVKVFAGSGYEAHEKLNASAKK